MSLILNKLPKEHPARNAPMGKLGVMTRHKARGAREIKVQALKIRDNSFNDLAPVWTEHGTFYLPEGSESSG